MTRLSSASMPRGAPGAAKGRSTPPSAALSAWRRSVFSSSLTTIAAFIPLLVISDIIGQIIKSIPMVVIAVIIASLIECFFVLPGHMRGALRWNAGRRSAPRVWFNNHFDRFRDGPFQAGVRLALHWRYVTLAIAAGALILSIGLVAGGRVGFSFFPSPEADRIYANVQFTAGSPRIRTLEMLQDLERRLLEVEDGLTGGRGGLVRMSLIKVGSHSGLQSRFPASGDHAGSVVVELTPSDERDIRTRVIIDAWRKQARLYPGVEFLTIRAAQGGPPGREVDVRISGDDLPSLKKAVDRTRKLLAGYPGVSAVSDNLPYGKQETILEVTPTQGGPSDSPPRALAVRFAMPSRAQSQGVLRAAMKRSRSGCATGAAARIPPASPGSICVGRPAPRFCSTKWFRRPKNAVFPKCCGRTACARRRLRRIPMRG